MKSKRTPGRSLDEWMQLVTECRQSGLTDAAWCHEHDISPAVSIMQFHVFANLLVRYHHQLQSLVLLTLLPTGRMLSRLP